MFVLLRTKRMQLRNHADTQTVKRSKQWSVTRAMRYIYIYICSIKFEISARDRFHCASCLVVLRISAP